jgi:hypothetical protein
METMRLSAFQQGLFFMLSLNIHVEGKLIRYRDKGGVPDRAVSEEQLKVI